MQTNYLPTDYQTFITTSRYSRWLEDQGRRETWPETVNRFMQEVVSPKLSGRGSVQDYQDIEKAILGLKVMPSMRSLMTSGPALHRDNTCAYNCAFTTVESVEDFSETMFVLMCGTGMGFSVERQFVSKLPEVPAMEISDKVVVVQDSKEGWADALKEYLEYLYSGIIPKVDTSLVRPAGTRLKTFGGRASGPQPLEDLFKFVCAIFIKAQGRKLSSIECHDIMCKIGEVVVVGGVRRSAMISLSNLSDNRMRYAKSGQWWEGNTQRALANNSVCYTEKPDSETFLREWLALMESKSGERGIFNREASVKQAKKSGRREVYKGISPSALVTWVDEKGKRTGPPKEEWEFGTNPCSEIILRPHQFCNLTEVVVRAEDTLETLKEKVRIATILGTIQSTLTHFPYLRDIWKQNTEEERLLGVSLTGILDNKILSGTSNQYGGNLEVVLTSLKQVAIDTNKEWSEILGVPQSTAITCVKPSGTVSQLVDSASGIHPRHSEYYIRTVRGDNKDPLTQFMIAQGIPNEPDVMKPDNTTVFSFPQKSPEGATTRDHLTAIQQLELWLAYQRYWCEHKPSITVNVRDSEWVDVGAWVYKHFDEISGISFLPFSDHTYAQAPYQECDKATYDKFVEMSPKAIDWSALQEYEKEDATKSSQTFACSGDSCEIVDIN